MTQSKWPRIKWNQSCAELANKPFEHIFDEPMTLDEILAAKRAAGQCDPADMQRTMDEAQQRMNEIEMERGRTVYLTTTVDNGYEADALVEHATPDTISEARKWALHNLDWFGTQQGFKVTCRISIDNVFEEITKYDPIDFSACNGAALTGIADQGEDFDAYMRALCADRPDGIIEQYSSATEGRW